MTRFFPDYTLDDYADVMYGDGTIKNNGCSVCCMAVAATYLTGHQYYPDELAKWFGSKANNNVDRLRYMANALHLPMTEAENYNFVKEALWEGKIVIQLMNGKSLFTKSQHFILLKGFNEDGRIMVYDPSNTNRSSWRLAKGLRMAFLPMKSAGATMGPLSWTRMPCRTIPLSTRSLSGSMWSPAMTA